MFFPAEAGVPEFAVCFHRDGAVQCWPQSCVFYFLISGPCGPSIIFALVCHGLSFGLRTLLGEKGIRASVPVLASDPCLCILRSYSLYKLSELQRFLEERHLALLGYGSLRQVKMLRFEAMDFCP